MSPRPLPRLVAITDWRAQEAHVLAVVRALSVLGPRIAVQHRHPEAAGRVFFEQARALMELCGPARVPLFVNGRLDVALAVGAHLHLPAHEVSPAEARPHLPQGRWLSAAVHDEAEARWAHGADLALVSPVFGAGSKPGDARPPLGEEGFRRIAAELGCPAYALGGITPERAAGFDGVACVSGLFGQDVVDPVAHAEALLNPLSQNGRGPG